MTQEEHDAYQNSWRKQWDDFTDACGLAFGGMFGFVVIALFLIAAGVGWTK